MAVRVHPKARPSSLSQRESTPTPGGFPELFPVGDHPCLPTVTFFLVHLSRTHTRFINDPFDLGCIPRRADIKTSLAFGVVFLIADDDVDCISRPSFRASAKKEKRTGCLFLPVRYAVASGFELGHAVRTADHERAVGDASDADAATHAASSWRRSTGRQLRDPHGFTIRPALPSRRRPPTPWPGWRPCGSHVDVALR